MRVTYNGPLASGSVGTGPAFLFERGKPIEVPDDFAEKLLATEAVKDADGKESQVPRHPDWSAADAPRAERKAR